MSLRDMDSGNSGSLQSSSGGDEEYDSRAESFSAFLNPPPPHQPSHHHNPNSSMFDPLSNFFDPLPRPVNPNPLLNLEAEWSKSVRSDPNCTDGNPMLVPPPPPEQPFFGSSSSPAVSFAAAENNIQQRASSSSATTDGAHAVVRNPKKRSRASRRAPTTVLTTDTTNFRAMVQEFTGIPTPPFTSSPFPRARLDLFGTPSTIRSNPLDIASQPPPYLLRPFAQKFQPPSFISSSPSSSPTLASPFLTSSVADANNISSATSTASVLNMQNSFLTFQSLLHSAPKYPLANSGVLGSKSQGSLEIPSNDPHLKTGGLDDFGLAHGHVHNPTQQLTGLPSLVSSDNAGQSQTHLRPVNGNYDFSGSISNGKLSYSASSSDYQGDKASQNVPATRGTGGMVESWICSSDLVILNQAKQSENNDGGNYDNNT
ncbi:hypothetical protein NMG60_11007318 [Bertholletia excelsa]